MGSLDELAQLTDANALLVAESVLAADGMNDSANKLRVIVAGVLPDAMLDNQSGQPSSTSSSDKVEYF
jgi:hypothetical protein